MESTGKVTSKGAVIVARIEFQRDFEDGEETNQWLTTIINGLQQAEKDLDKLGQVEKIEEELGIDLITFFKALKYGVYYFSNGTQLTRDYVYLMNNYISVRIYDRLSYSFITAFERQTLSFNDYGKTWALTKEELE